MRENWPAALDDFRNCFPWACSPRKVMKLVSERLSTLVDSRSGVIWHFSPLFRLLPSSGYLEQMLRERAAARVRVERGVDLHTLAAVLADGPAASRPAFWV
jgi:hypothetical protein